MRLAGTAGTECLWSKPHATHPCAMIGRRAATCDLLPEKYGIFTLGGWGHAPPEYTGVITAVVVKGHMVGAGVRGALPGQRVGDRLRDRRPLHVAPGATTAGEPAAHAAPGLAKLRDRIAMRTTIPPPRLLELPHGRRWSRSPLRHVHVA